MKRAILILLVLTSLAAANDFSGDPNVVGIWNFEDGTFLSDSSGSGYTLTNDSNNITEDSTYYMQGSGSANNTGNTYRLYVADASLGSDFPGAGHLELSMTCWIRPTTLPTSGQYQLVTGKWDSAGSARSWALYLTHDGTDVIPGFYLGTGTGGTATYYLFESSKALQTVDADEWYHMAWSYWDPAGLLNLWKMTLWSETDTDWGYGAMLDGLEMAQDTADFSVFNRDDENQGFIGSIDEVVVWNRPLNDYELQAVRAGTYSYPVSAPYDLANEPNDDPNLVRWYRMESPGQTVDSSPTGNNLTYSYHWSYQQDRMCGTAAGYALDSSAAYNHYMSDLNSDLDAAFPGKNGTSNSTFSATLWICPVMVSARTTSDLLGIWDVSGDRRSWKVGTYVNSGERHITLSIGYDSGATEELIECTDIDVLNGHWYHLGVTFDGGTKGYRIRIYDLHNDSVTEKTGTTTNAMNIEDGEFVVGNSEDKVTGYSGYMDDVMIFNDVLTADEIDEIRSGTYGSTDDTATSKWWWRRRHN